MSNCFQLSRFREVGKKIVGLARTYRLWISDKRDDTERRDQLIYEGRGIATLSLRLQDNRQWWRPV